MCWNYFPFFSLGDLDSATEAALLGDESPISVSQLASNSIEENLSINTKKYFREVRKILYSMGHENASFFCGRIMSGDKFHTDKSDPKFDAWCLVFKAYRPSFDSKAFFENYPTAQEQIRYLQNKMEIWF